MTYLRRRKTSFLHFSQDNDQLNGLPLSLPLYATIIALWATSTSRPFPDQDSRLAAQWKIPRRDCSSRSNGASVSSQSWETRVGEQKKKSFRKQIQAAPRRREDRDNDMMIHSGSTCAYRHGIYIVPPALFFPRYRDHRFREERERKGQEEAAKKIRF